jgi:hypothetical protein
MSDLDKLQSIWIDTEKKKSGKKNYIYKFRERKNDQL